VCYTVYRDSVLALYYDETQGLGIYRNGDTKFSYDDGMGLYACDINVTVHADGSRKIEYRYESEMHVDTM